MNTDATRAVTAAALVLGDADTTDATCYGWYGWVPQAHAALKVALDVDEMARAIDPRAFGPITPGSSVSRYARAQQVAHEKATAVRAAILGEDR
jgi:hypothetical protein